MIIYLLNKGQQTIKAISTDDTVEAKFTEAINQANQLTLSLPLSKRLDSNIFYALFQKPESNDFLMFKLNDESIENDRITYTGIDAAYDELKAYGYVKDIRPTERTAKEILEQVLKGTHWEVGYIDSTSPISTNFYYQPYLACIQQIIKLFNLEVTFTYSFNPKTHEITSRQVNLYQQQGKRTGKRFEYGSNLLEVTREEDSQDIYTALVGRGKGEEITDDETGEATGGYGRRINFSDVVWSKAKGDPVDKPAGQEFVEDPKATKVFGYADGKPRIGIVVFDDIEDSTELLNATWSSLKTAERPKASLKAKVTDVGDLGLGDTIAIIRHDIGIEYFTRVFKVNHDLKNKQNNTIEMGDDMSRDSITDYIAGIDDMAENAQKQAIYAAVSANSKNKNYYATTKPKYANENDNLFLNLGNGQFEYWVWHNGQWEFVQSTQDLQNVEVNVKQVQGDLAQAKADADNNNREANEAITTINKNLTGLQAKVADGVNQSQFDQLSDQLKLKVSKGDVIAQINEEAGSTLIQNKKIFLDADNVIFGGSAFIPSATISNITADKITSGTLDAGKINVINVNADNIVSGIIHGANSSWDLNTGQIHIGNNKSFVEIHDGEINLSQNLNTKTSFFKIKQIFPYHYTNKDVEAPLAAAISAPEAVMLTLDNNKLQQTYDWDPIVDADNLFKLEDKNIGILVRREEASSSDPKFPAYRDKSVIISGGAFPIQIFGGVESESQTYLAKKLTIPSIIIGAQMFTLGDNLPNGKTFTDYTGIQIEGEFTHFNCQWNTFEGSVLVGGDLNVDGSKNAVVPTSQGMVAINAYETAEYYFGDIGKAKTDDQGQVLIKLDPLFLETINTDVPYHVFVSPYGKARVWVEQLNHDSFLAKSDQPNIPFSWEIKAKRKGYEKYRLKVTNNKIPEKMKPMYAKKGIYDEKSN